MKISVGRTTLQRRLSHWFSLGGVEDGEDTGSGMRLMGWDDQDGDAGFPDHVFAGATEEKLMNEAVAVGAYDD